MYIWKLTREADGIEEPIVAIVGAEDENAARLAIIATLAEGSSSYAGEFALDSTKVEKIGTMDDPYGDAGVYAIESTDFRKLG